MDVVVMIQVVGEGYHNLAKREIMLRDLANANDIANVSYDVGRLVGPVLQTLAKQLDPQAHEDVEVIE